MADSLHGMVGRFPVRSLLSMLLPFVARRYQHFNKPWSAQLSGRLQRLVGQAQNGLASGNVPVNNHAH